jgi:hypothetical protein
MVQMVCVYVLYITTTTTTAHTHMIASFQNNSKNNAGVFVCVHDVNCNKMYEMAGKFFINTYGSRTRHEVEVLRV